MIFVVGSTVSFVISAKLLFKKIVTVFFNQSNYLAG
jgi:hypothetical protein